MKRVTHLLKPRSQSALLLLATLASMAIPAARAGTLPKHNISAANISVIQNDTDNTPASVTAETTLSINDFRLRPDSNRGDYNVQIGDTAPDDLAEGLLMTSITENGRDNLELEALGTNYTTSSFDGNASGYWVLVQDTSVDRAEYNANVAAAFFRYTNWLGGWARNATGANGGTNNLFTGSPGLVLGTHFKGVAGGRSMVDLRSLGINSSSSGVLIVNHAKNEGNFALSTANTDGTWSLFVKDNHGDNTSYEQDPVAFVYIPRTNKTVISGKFQADSSILMYSDNTPQFAVTNTDVGTWRLTIPGYSPADGVLIVSPEGGKTLNNDNIVSYQADGNSWLIQSRDIPSTNGFPTLETPTNEPVASFVFIPAATQGFTINPTNSILTTEAGATATFTVQLDLAPKDDVVINLSSSNPAEGIVSPATLTFTTNDWNIPQTVTVTGQDDLIADGPATYSIILSPVISNDTGYNNLAPNDVTVINADNDQAGITIHPTSGLVTAEGGSNATFQVFLNRQPAADVTFGFSSSNTAEGQVSPASVTFNAADWNIPKIITVTGVDDFKQDGNISYTIITTHAVSADPNYNGINPSDVSVVNDDNDTVGFVVNAGLPIIVAEQASTNYSITLATQPDADVVVQVVSSDTTAGMVSPSTLTFTPSDWNTPKFVTVTGTDDLIVNPSFSVSFVISNLVSTTDSLYSALSIPIMPAVKTDNEMIFKLPSGDCIFGLGMPAIGIDGRASVVDVDTANYAAGSVTFAFTANGNAADTLVIRSLGTAEGQISTSADSVSYGANVIGSFTGGSSGSPLVVSFNTNASPAAVQELLRSVTFHTATNVNSLATRTLAVTLNDGLGATATINKSVRVGALRQTQYQEGADYGYGNYSGAADIALSEVGNFTPWPLGRNVNEGLLIDWPDGGTLNSSEALLRFDNFVGDAFWQIPTNAVIVSAELLVNVNNTGDGGTLHRMLMPWDATNDVWITYGEGIDADDFEASSVYESQMGVQDGSGATGTGIISIGVTPDVQAWVNGTNNYGWVIIGWPFNTDGTGFTPSENANVDNRPRLRVLWLPAEETQMASFRQGVNDYTNAFDTRIRAISPDTNYSTVTGVFVDAAVSSTNDEEHVLIRFDEIVGTNPGQIPPGVRVEAAMLDLSSVIGNAMGDGGHLHALLMPWDNATTTWNTWDNGVQADGIEAAVAMTAIAGSTNLEPNVQGAFLSFEVTPDVQAWVNGVPNNGWVWLPWPGGGDGWGFGTAESALERDRPQLRVFYSTAPGNVTAAFMQPLAFGPSQVQVKFTGTAGKTYEIRRAASLSGPWTAIGTATVIANGTGSFTDNTPLPDAAFYRVVYP